MSLERMDESFGAGSSCKRLPILAGYSIVHLQLTSYRHLFYIKSQEYKQNIIYYCIYCLVLKKYLKVLEKTIQVFDDKCAWFG